MKIKRRLNNKGFTLIELLAVVVILAVVMGIATNAVLSSMNKARGGSLADTAQVIANAFNTKYTESLVDGIADRVYDDLDGDASGYNFSSNSGTYYINSALATIFNISTTNYMLKDSSGVAETLDASVVNYNSTTGKFIVCMVATTGGNVYVKSSTTNTVSGIDNISSPAATM